MLLNEARARAYLDHCQLDAIIATSPVNIRYLTEYCCWLDPLMKQYMLSPGTPNRIFQGYALYPRDGEPALIVSPAFAANAVDLGVDVRFYGDPGLHREWPPGPVEERLQELDKLLASPTSGETPTDALLSVVRDRGLDGARLGLEIEPLPDVYRSMIEAALPGSQIKDCTNLFRLIRMVKSEQEIERLAGAAAISEAAGLASARSTLEGVSLSAAIQDYRSQVAASGADFEHFIYGLRGLGLAQEPDYTLEDDDILCVDFGCIYKGYFSDTAMTIEMPQAPRPLRDRYGDLQACVAAALDCVRPGVPSSVVQEAMVSTMAARGVTATFPHGHGLGLEIRDYPILVPDNGLHISDDCVDEPSNLPLEENMVINLEVTVMAPGIGSVEIEQTFVVTAEGSRPLVEQDRGDPIS
jgi:Xaa-Pro dipeptidase